MCNRISFFILAVMTTTSASPWGFKAHQALNYYAVFTLPPEMFGFYKKHIEFISEHAVDADKRKYVSDVEAPRHYIDLDYYGEYPFPGLPRYRDDAVCMYSEDTVMANGNIPWHIPLMVKWLEQAFIEKDVKKILRLSADLGHYIADAHVPLHTTSNYNGQLTGQRGIHGFWETRLPLLFQDGYDFLTGQAQYAEYPLMDCWKIVLESHAAVDSVLLFERKLNAIFPSDQKYSFVEKGGLVSSDYSEEYSIAYHDMLDGMVERRMRATIAGIGSFWLTAWINAGQPDLDALLSEENATDEDENALDKQVPEGVLHGRECK